MANWNARITVAELSSSLHIRFRVALGVSENKFRPYANSLFSFETFCLRTRFETEAKGNLEIASLSKRGLVPNMSCICM